MPYIPGDLAAEASKVAKFVIAKAAKKKFVMIMAIALRSPKIWMIFYNSFFHPLPIMITAHATKQVKKW